MIDSYFNGWIGIALLVINSLFLAYVGSFWCVLSVIYGIVAGIMISRKI